MRDIKQASVAARPIVLCGNALILNGHFIARKRHHARAAFAVPRIKRQLGQSFCVSFAQSGFLPKAVMPARKRALVTAPSVGKPESLAAHGWAQPSPSVTLASRKRAFQSVDHDSGPFA